jgi:cellulase/cellobiase CelA1
VVVLLWKGIYEKGLRANSSYETSDTIANIAKMEPAIADTPCSDILGLVIYDLPGRDCAAKASNGELKYSEISRYKSEYIDRELLFSTSSSPNSLSHQGRVRSRDPAG